MNNIDENVHINIFIKDKGNLLANATVSFLSFDYGFITIKNFQIWRSTKFNDRLQASINIAPPSQQAFGKYHLIVFFEQEQKWFGLEQMIYDNYLNKRKVSEPCSEDIDIDEIDRAITNSQQ